MEADEAASSLNAVEEEDEADEEVEEATEIERGNKKETAMLRQARRLFSLMMSRHSLLHFTSV